MHTYFLIYAPLQTCFDSYWYKCINLKIGKQIEILLVVEWPMDEEETRYIEAEFEGPWGDRQQGLTFIGGKSMDVNQLKIQLDNALLISVELALGPEVWKDTFEDTFPPWNMIDVPEKN